MAATRALPVWETPGELCGHNCEKNFFCVRHALGATRVTAQLKYEMPGLAWNRTILKQMRDDESIVLPPSHRRADQEPRLKTKTVRSRTLG
jgi:hypothetical protein